MKAAFLSFLCFWLVAGTVWARAPQKAPIPPFRGPAHEDQAVSPWPAQARGGAPIPPFRGQGMGTGLAQAPRRAKARGQIPTFRLADQSPLPPTPAAPSAPAAAPSVEKQASGPGTAPGAGPEKGAETAAAPGTPGAKLDFDFFDDSNKPKLTESQTAARLQESLKLDRKVKLRRNMLLAHQAIGFITLAGLAATAIVGTLNYTDKYTSGNFTGRYQDAHLYLSSTTSVLFATTGMLALLAPNPYPKPYRFDTAMVHRIAMALAAAGMLTEIIIGPLTAVPEAGKLAQPSWALTHAIIGWSSFGFMGIGTVAYLF
jgi:hypothetical protein